MGFFLFDLAVEFIVFQKKIEGFLAVKDSESANRFTVFDLSLENSVLSYPFSLLNREID